ncbi:MAG TPA: PVC-type heme-binding CxxCH protein, partial [Gemmataceae bacterium]
VWYEGFEVENPQLRVSHPKLGIDGWVYVANGLRGGKVKRAGRPDAEAADLGGKDFRFDPLGGRGEVISGMGQFGNDFDRWGNRFVCDNRHHLRHVVFPQSAAKRNPYLALPAVLEDISVLEDGPLSSGGKVYPLSRNWTTSSQHAGRFTAACGVFLEKGGLLGGAYDGAAFTCEPTGNLVHAEVLEPSGATFRSRPVREGVEFLATPDEWFRPVFLTHDPEGALVLVDMYRAVIEHPQFMPPELKERPDLTLGKERGRIWRIVPEKYRRKAEKPDLKNAPAAELVGLLGHPNDWWRSTAQRLLLERQEHSARELLTGMCQSSKVPEARVRAAWLLESFGALDAGVVRRLLGDAHPRVRDHAVRIAAGRLAKEPALGEAVAKLAGDPDAQVRFRVALALGAWDGPETLGPLAEIALRGAADKWTRWAVACAVPDRAGGLIRTLIERESGLVSEITPDRLQLLRELCELAGARRDVGEVGEVLTLLAGLEGDAAARWQMAGLNGLAAGMSRRGTQLGAFLAKLPAEHKPAVSRATELFREASRRAGESQGDVPERVEAVRLLAHAPWEIAGAALAPLPADAAAPQDVRLAAVQALSAHPRPEVPAMLLEDWRGYTPAVRTEVAQAMLQRPERVRALLDALASGTVKPGDLDPERTRRLVNYRVPELRERARKVLAASMPADRKEVLARYRAALQTKGDALRGREVFRKNCANCHEVGGVGTRVGPDIADTRTKTEEMLLTDILNPNQAIDSNYINYSVETNSGKLLTGFIAVETATSITLVREQGQSDVVLKQDVASMSSTGVSLMPEGLEKNITVAEMADLLRYLKDWRYLGGAVPVGSSGSGSR